MSNEGSGEQPTSVEASSTLEENIRQLLMPFGQSRVSGGEWTLNENLENVVQALLSLYQKELVRAMDERDKRCAKHGHIILKGEAAKRYLELTGEQP